jgi:hypothetical protein
MPRTDLQRITIGAPALTSLLINRLRNSHSTFDMSIYHGVRKTMKKDTILEVFGYLKSKQLVSGESEFSEHWLGCSEGYMRKLRSSQSEPSLGAVAICASRLQNAAEQFEVLPRYQPLAKQLTSMSIKCRSLVDAESVEFELVA